MNITKLCWHIRTLLSKPFYKNMGNFCYMGKPCYIAGKKYISIGSKVRIFPGCRLEAENGGELIIKDNTSIGENFHVYSGNKSVLKIGENTTISSNVLITNTDHDYKQIGIHIMEQPTITKETVIGDNCFIGHSVCILAGAKIGSQCIIGANAVVISGEYPDYSVLAGIPAKIIKRYIKSKGIWESN